MSNSFIHDLGDLLYRATGVAPTQDGTVQSIAWNGKNTDGDVVAAGVMLAIDL